MDRAELDDLKSRVDLIELFRGYGLEPKKKGRSWFCRCPFHDDSTASLSITPQERLWNCFGCQAGGDALEFLRLKENLDFPAALALLKERAGQAASQAEPPAQKRAEERRGELLGRVAELYRKRFQENQQGREYLAVVACARPNSGKLLALAIAMGLSGTRCPAKAPSWNRSRSWGC